jgi:hypothetical protein
MINEGVKNMPLFKRKKSKSVEKKKVVASKKKKPASPSIVPVGTDSFRGSALKVEENKFYILVKKPKESDDEEEEENKEITLYSTVKAPITQIKEYLRSEVDVDCIELMTVKILDEALEAESVPWNKIAVELIG